jgi:hypothetical protein
MVGMQILAMLVALVAPAAAEEAKPSGYAGEDVCTACHAEQAESYGKTPHATALADATRPEALRGCEACHGPGKRTPSGGREGRRRSPDVREHAGGSRALRRLPQVSRRVSEPA